MHSWIFNKRIILRFPKRRRYLNLGQQMFNLLMKPPWVIRIWVEDCAWLLKGRFNAKTEAKALGLRRKQNVQKESASQN